MEAGLEVGGEVSADGWELSWGLEAVENSGFFGGEPLGQEK